jgi:hypothetical protein
LFDHGNGVTQNLRSRPTILLCVVHTPLAPFGLNDIPQRVPILARAPVVMATRANSSTGMLHDEGRAVAMIRIPGAHWKDPLAPLLPDIRANRIEAMLGNPPVKVERLPVAWHGCLFVLFCRWHRSGQSFQ